MDISSVIDKLHSLRVDETILFAYLFGSQARGGIDDHSDIDVAVFLNGELDGEVLLNKKLEIIADIADLFERDDIDLIILNEDNVSMHFEIINDGILIFERNMMDRIDWETHIISKWMDWKLTLDIWREGFNWQKEHGLLWQ